LRQSHCDGRDDSLDVAWIDHNTALISLDHNRQVTRFPDYRQNRRSGCEVVIGLAWHQRILGARSDRDDGPIAEAHRKGQSFVRLERKKDEQSLDATRACIRAKLIVLGPFADDYESNAIVAPKTLGCTNEQTEVVRQSDVARV
jgi:hypothetical protein